MARRNRGPVEPWWVSKPHLLDEAREEVDANHPLLRVEIQDGVYVVGVLLVHVDNEAVGSFPIVMGFPPDYPQSMPWVFESGDRIPKTLDRHVFTGSGVACLIVPEEWQAADDRSFHAFMAGPVRDYFLGQLIYDEKGSFPHGERDHGTEGLIESYSEMIGIENEEIAVRRWLRCLTKRQLKGHFDCPCGSGIRLRDCCLSQVREVQSRIPPELAVRMLARLNVVTG